MSAKLYYKNESYGRIIAEEGVLAENTEALLDFAKRYNFKNDKNGFLTFIVDEEMTLANNKTIPLHGYQGKLTVTKNNQDTITLENLWVEATPTFRRASREACIPLFFEYGYLMSYRFSRGKAAFNDISRDMTDTFKTDAVSVTANDFTLEGHSDSQYAITYNENENSLSVLYDVDANVCGLIYNRYSLHSNVAEQDYTFFLTHLEDGGAQEIEILVNQMLNSAYEKEENPVLFDVLVHTIVTYIKENQLDIQTSITKISPRNRPYFAIGDHGLITKMGTYCSVPLKSHYATKWKEELETGKKTDIHLLSVPEEVAVPKYIDADILATALYNRFHEDGQANNITMVPLGEVIKFIREMSEFDKEAVTESEFESEQDAESDYERD